MSETHISKGKGHGAAPKEEKPEVKMARHFRRNIFLSDESSGQEYDKKGKPIEGKIKSEIVDIPEHLEQKYVNILSGYATNLQEAVKRNPTLLNNPQHEHDKKILEKLVNADGEISDNGQEIKNFLSTPEGYKIATGIIEHNAMMKMLGLGLIEMSKPTGIRQQGIPAEISLGFESGAMAWLKGRPGGAESYKIDTRSAAKALQVLKNNPQEKDFLRAVWHIDLDDFEVNAATNTVSRRENWVPRTADPKRLRAEVYDALQVRREFYTTLGIPATSLDRSPGQFLFGVNRRLGRNINSRDLTPEQTGYRPHLDILDAFNQNVNMLDAAGRPVTDPNFTPENLRTGENVMRYMEVQRQMMTKMVEEHIRREQERKIEAETPTRPVTAIEGKVRERTEEAGRVRALKTEAFTREKDLTTSLEDLVAEEKGSIDTYAEAVKALVDSRKQIRDYTTVPGRTLDDKFEWIRKQRLDATVAGSYAAELADFRARKQSALDAEYARITYPPGANKNTKDTLQNEATARVTERFADDEDLLKKRLADLERQENELKDIRTNVDNQQQILIDTSETATSVEKTIKKLRSDFNSLFTLGISANDLATSDIPTLLTRINAAHTASLRAGGAIVGWPASENEQIEHRQLLENARIYGKAEVKADTDLNRHTRQIHLSRLTGWGISENQLRTLNRNQVIAYFNNRFSASRGRMGWQPSQNGTYAPIVEMAMIEAWLNVEHLRNALTDEGVILQDRQKALNKAIEGVDLSTEINTLERTKDLMTRYGDILSGAKQIVDVKTRDSFTDGTLVTLGDRLYSDSERALLAEKGYYEFMDLLFKYKDKPDRSDVLKKISEFLPPNKLLEILNRELSLNASAGITIVTLAGALFELRNQIALGNIDQLRMREVMSSMISTFEKEALAMT